MNFQGKSLEQYMQAGEVLYALQASKKYGNRVVGKVALQKLIYLSVVLAPIKDIIIHFLRFHYQIRGPFNYELQNTVDHLMGLGYVKLEEYNFINEKRILVSYSITEKGEKTVYELAKISNEEDKKWWIECVCQLAISYSEGEFESDWSGLDRVVDLVYQDPTFKKGKIDEKSFRTGIDIGGEK